MGILSFFKNTKIGRSYQVWKELGTYRSIFTRADSNIYRNEIVRSCVRVLSEHSSKAFAKSSDKKIAKILNEQPNMYMNGKDFLAKVRIHLELKNTAFIYVQRDDKGRFTGAYPIPYSWYEALEYSNGLFIKFHFNGNATSEKVFAWEDLVVLRKDYYESDIAGDENDVILNTLELINTTNQGIANAVKATANLRGILKSTKSMLSPEDIKKQKETFVKDYLNLENEGGIASLDSTQEFTAITMSPTVVNYTQMKEFRENVYRYFGVNDKMIMSEYSEAEMEAFYNSRIEPFLVALSTEMTRKVFSEREKGFGAYIIYESNKIQFATWKTKLQIFKDVVQYGGMTVNEWRAGCNMEPIEGGDVPIRRLDAAEVDQSKTKEGEHDES